MPNNRLSYTVRRSDYFSQLDDDDLSLNSGRRTTDSANNNNSNNHLANLVNNNSNGITLGPVIMKKSMTGDGSANSFNNRRKLPSHPQPKARSTPLTPEKVTFDAKMRHSATAPPTKKMQSLSVNSSRSSASSTSDTNSAKESVRHWLANRSTNLLLFPFCVSFTATAKEKTDHTARELHSLSRLRSLFQQWSNSEAWSYLRENGIEET